MDSFQRLIGFDFIPGLLAERLMGDVKQIGDARARRRLAETFGGGVEHGQRVITIAWDATAEWHAEGRHGAGLWVVYGGRSTVPYARQVNLRKALHYAGEVFRGRVWCEHCARFVFVSPPADVCSHCRSEVEHIWDVGDDWKSA